MQKHPLEPILVRMEWLKLNTILFPSLLQFEYEMSPNRLMC
jgi:hypothetical protein